MNNNQEEGGNQMLWTELSYVKEHSRICTDCEDAVLELYAISAEQAILNILNRPYEDIIGQYGDVPAPIRHATLLLIDNFYEHRSPGEKISFSAVPYNIDILVKPYMNL